MLHIDRKKPQPVEVISGRHLYFFLLVVLFNDHEAHNPRMPFCTVVHAIKSAKAALRVVVVVGGLAFGRVVIILHSIYSFYALTSHIYICPMSYFYLHTRLELCNLFLTLQNYFCQCKTCNVYVWTKSLNVSAHNLGVCLRSTESRVVPTTEPEFRTYFTSEGCISV